MTDQYDGSDAAKGKFVYSHPDCGTVYADSAEEAAAAAFVRIARHDPEAAPHACVNVSLIGINTTPKDWKPEVA